MLEATRGAAFCAGGIPAAASSLFVADDIRALYTQQQF